ncbi:hypothetical protein AAVH_07451 [Aphelenchoides avenae]|nr:hypothetical protein AAVH_07451 [Aphelenchus avenae]
MVAFTCINRHSVFVNRLSGQLPTIGALLAIGCLQPPASLASHASSASLEPFHRYASVLIGVAVLGHHTAEAKPKEVNNRNFNKTSYYGSPVSLQNNNMIEMSDDSCKWRFVWDQAEKFTLGVNEENFWKFVEPPPPITKLGIMIQKTPPTMGVCVVNGKGYCQPIDMKKSVDLKPPDYCMLATDTFSVNMTLTEPKCAINVTIINAELLYDFFEPTTAPTTTLLPLWTGSGPPPGTGYRTRPVTNTTRMNVATENTSTTTAGPPLTTGAIIGIAAGALVLIALVAGAVIAFICIRRRRRQQEQGDYYFVEDPQLSAQVEKDEGLIEWEDVMAHAPYDLNTQAHYTNWPYGKGDTVRLSSITASEFECSRQTSEVKFVELVFEDDVKGTEDYGFVEGRLEPKDDRHADKNEPNDWTQAVVIYYSFPPDRVKVCVVSVYISSPSVAILGLTVLADFYP